MKPFSICLRSQNVCPHCFAEQPGTGLRNIYLDGVQARCAVCNWDLGDSVQLEIPNGPANIFRLLVARNAFAVHNFHGENTVAPKLGVIDLINRACPNVRCQLDWQKPSAPGAQGDGGFKAVPVNGEKLKLVPPIVAATVTPLMQLGAVPIEANLNPEEGQMRFRLHNIITITTAEDTVKVKTDGQSITISNSSEPIDASMITRIQLSWRK